MSKEPSTSPSRWIRYDSTVVMGIRSWSRAMGLTRVAGRVLQRSGRLRNYEHAFGSRLMATIRSSDVVWDVGANVGLYTVKFAERCAPNGRVIAFEPLPEIRERLRTAISDLGNVTIRDVALSSECGSAAMAVEGVDSVASHVVLGDEKTLQGKHQIRVQMSTAQQEMQDGVPPPNIVKIDIEGHELAALEGFGEYLHSPNLRRVFVEVHSTALESLGHPQGAREVVDILSLHGLSVTWIDPSHLEAFRS